MSNFGHIVRAYNAKTVQQKYKGNGKMEQKTADGTSQKAGEVSKCVRCPHLSSSSQKTCLRMVEEGLDGKVSDFDIQHFCNGNPVHCYFFRFPCQKSKERFSLF